MTAQTKSRGSIFVALLLLALLALAGWQLMRVQDKIAAAEAEKSLLTAEVESARSENDALSAALEKADDPEYLKELAREQLDMVTPGEKVFYDISN